LKRVARVNDPGAEGTRGRRKTLIEIET
jgi:hypothetical protein